MPALVAIDGLVGGVFTRAVARTAALARRDHQGVAVHLVVEGHVGTVFADHAVIPGVVGAILFEVAEARGAIVPEAPVTTSIAPTTHDGVRAASGRESEQEQK